MDEYHLFTSESVSEGHPDKIADQISDAILDEALRQDLHSRVACETLVKTGMVLVGGEITTNAWVDVDYLARQVIRDIGYNSSSMGFDWESCAILSAIGKQSSDIALGVDASPDKPLGAGDQGMMFGYASDETEVLMPLPITLAHRLVKRQAEARKKHILSWLRPDAKSQVTLRYREGIPYAIDTIVFSTQHDPDVSHASLIEGVMEEIIKHEIPEGLLLPETRYFINPTGRFVVGGPLGDCGLTGRKIIVDTYGGMARHGGGCFSGKDPTKVDRTGAYAARYVAKNIVASGLARRCELQLSYAIGRAEPISISIETFGTGQLPEAEIVRLIERNFDLTPRGIISHLGLLRPLYRPTATYGHFGREDLSLPWEALDKVALLK